MIPLARPLGITTGFFNYAAWALIALGLLALYVPTYSALLDPPPGATDDSPAPFVLAITLFLLWRQRHVFFDTLHLAPHPGVGLPLLLLGLGAYVLGRSQDILILELGSQIVVLIGVLLWSCGTNALRQLWFPLLFLAFTIPLPGVIVDTVTGPLKQIISQVVENVLYAVGYPIARHGVVLSIGSYQLLVADACSGLSSMFTLTAMGMLYLYLVRHPSRLRMVLILASLWPIAFIANTIRVMVLALITYHLGDEVGQGFLHDFAGVLLFTIAMLLLFGLDLVLSRLLKPRISSRHAQ